MWETVRPMHGDMYVNVRAPRIARYQTALTCDWRKRNMLHAMPRPMQGEWEGKVRHRDVKLHQETLWQVRLPADYQPLWFTDSRWRVNPLSGNRCRDTRAEDWPETGLLIALPDRSS